ncbi:hypothetical protein D9M68_834010 [compost metagenome]
MLRVAGDGLAHHLAGQVASQFKNVARDLLLAFLQVVFGVVQQLRHAHRGLFGGLAHRGFERIAHFVAAGFMTAFKALGIRLLTGLLQDFTRHAFALLGAGRLRMLIAAVHGREMPGGHAFDLFAWNEAGMGIGFGSHGQLPIQVIRMLRLHHHHRS